MRLLLLVTGVLFTCHPAARAGTFLWQASSGFTPDAVAIPMGLEDTATANPVLASGVLTLSTTGLGETMRYAHVGSGTLLVPALPEIEARVRHVSGSFDYPGRRAIGITFTVAAGVGASVMIGEDIVLTSISGGGGVSQSAVVDTDDAFHD